MKAIKIVGSILFTPSLVFSYQNEKKDFIEIKIIEKDGSIKIIENE